MLSFKQKSFAYLVQHWALNGILNVKCSNEWMKERPIIHLASFRVKLIATPPDAFIWRVIRDILVSANVTTNFCMVQSIRSERHWDNTLVTRSPPIGGARRNAAPLNLKVAADILCVINGDHASNCVRIIWLCHLDPFRKIQIVLSAIFTLVGNENSHVVWDHTILPATWHR